MPERIGEGALPPQRCSPRDASRRRLWLRQVRYGQGVVRDGQVATNHDVLLLIRIEYVADRFIRRLSRALDDKAESIVLGRDARKASRTGIEKDPRARAVPHHTVRHLHEGIVHENAIA